MDAVHLYHGSKSGLIGEIKPVSREYCDFGKGFYMGTEKEQALTLICSFPEARLYTVSVDLLGLQTLTLDADIDWALLIAYHRRKMEQVKGSTIYKKYSMMLNNYDIIIGYIANDRMFTVLDRFFAGEITDVALINSLAALKLGKQYVALTDTACNKISILDERKLTENERVILRDDSEIQRQTGIRLADEICIKHRRDGLFFDEIISGGC